MALGPAVRRLLGPRLARRAGHWYRRVFVDLAKEASALEAVIPRGAHVLDVGGGDGEPLNYLLALRPDLHVTTLDPAAVIGEWVDARFRAKVTKLPGTSVGQYLSSGRPDPDVILLADVMHHIPEQARPAFVASLSVVLERVPALRIVIKDVQPGHWRTWLAYWADRYVTGDANVSPISRERLVQLLEGALGPLQYAETALFEIDRPNYAMVFGRELKAPSPAVNVYA